MGEAEDIQENVDIAFSYLLMDLNNHFSTAEAGLKARNAIKDKWKKVEEGELKAIDALDSLCKTYGLPKPKKQYNDLAILEGKGIINTFKKGWKNVKNAWKKVKAPFKWIKKHGKIITIIISGIILIIAATIIYYYIL